MILKRLALIAALLATVLATGRANADEAKDSAVEELQKGQAEIRAELAQLRKDMQEVLKELKNLQAAQARQAQPQQQRQRQPDTTVYEVDIANSAVWGPKDAPVTIVEFSDFQCPYCIREIPTLKKIREEYPDDVKVVYKHFPLSFHKDAPPAHAAAEYARRVGGDDAFWKMHDMIAGNPRKLDKDTLRGYAEQLKLDLVGFDALMASEQKINELLAADKADAAKCKVGGTPTILINGVKLAPRTYDSYKSRIAEILKAKADAKQ